MRHGRCPDLWREARKGPHLSMSLSPLRWGPFMCHPQRVMEARVTNSQARRARKMRAADQAPESWERRIPCEPERGHAPGREILPLGSWALGCQRRCCPLSKKEEEKNLIVGENLPFLKTLPRSKPNCRPGLAPWLPSYDPRFKATRF